MNMATPVPPLVPVPAPSIVPGLAPEAAPPAPPVPNLAPPPPSACQPNSPPSVFCIPDYTNYSDSRIVTAYAHDYASKYGRHRTRAKLIKVSAIWCTSACLLVHSSCRQGNGHACSSMPAILPAQRRRLWLCPACAIFLLLQHTTVNLSAGSLECLANIPCIVVADMHSSRAHMTAHVY